MLLAQATVRHRIVEPKASLYSTMLLQLGRRGEMSPAGPEGRAWGLA